MNRAHPSHSNAPRMNHQPPPTQRPPMTSAPNSHSMPSRVRRGAPRRMRGSVQRRAMHSMNQHQQQPPPQPVAPVPAKEEPEYSAAATSSGTGFFGETNLLDKDPDAPPLPDDAEEVVERVRAYFDDILADENAVAAMTAAQAKGFQATSTKIVDALTELFAAQKMNHFAYESLVAIFESAQSGAYDDGLRVTREFSNECRRGKKARFATHRRWLIGFTSILRTAKQHGI